MKNSTNIKNGIAFCIKSDYDGVSKILLLLPAIKTIESKLPHTIE